MYGFPDYRSVTVAFPYPFDRYSISPQKTAAMKVRKLIYVTLLFLFMVIMFTAPFVYIFIRLHEKS
jgi:hypothetical protein